VLTIDYNVVHVAMHTHTARLAPAADADATLPARIGPGLTLRDVRLALLLEAHYAALAVPGAPEPAAASSVP
jgi:hypothetical protein